LVVVGNLSILQGVFRSASDYDDVLIGPAGTLELTNDINVHGNWTNDGGFISNGHTVFFNGTSDQNLGGANTTSFHNLTIAAGSNLFLSTLPSVSGSLTNNGVISQTQTIGPGATANYLQIGADKYHGVDITSHAGVNLGSVSLIVSGNAVCTDDPGSVNYRKRCFVITSENPGFADMTFYTTAGEDIVSNDTVYQFIDHATGWLKYTSVCGGSPGAACTVSGVGLTAGRNDFLIGQSASEPNVITLLTLRAGPVTFQGYLIVGAFMLTLLLLVLWLRRKTMTISVDI
jgi:hypothetical protein